MKAIFEEKKRKRTEKEENTKKNKKAVINKIAPKVNVTNGNLPKIERLKARRPQPERKGPKRQKKKLFNSDDEDSSDDQIDECTICDDESEYSEEETLCAICLDTGKITISQLTGQQGALVVQAFFENNSSYVTVQRLFRVKYGFRRINQCPSTNEAMVEEVSRNRFHIANKTSRSPADSTNRSRHRGKPKEEVVDNVDEKIRVLRRKLADLEATQIKKDGTKRFRQHDEITGEVVRHDDVAKPDDRCRHDDVAKPAVRQRHADVAKSQTCLESDSSSRRPVTSRTRSKSREHEEDVPYQSSNFNDPPSQQNNDGKYSNVDSEEEASLASLAHILRRQSALLAHIGARTSPLPLRLRMKTLLVTSYHGSVAILTLIAQISAAISAIGLAVTNLLKRKKERDVGAIHQLGEAGRLLTDLFHQEKLSRRELAALNLNKGLKDTFLNAPTDESLFGKDLEDRFASNNPRAATRRTPAISAASTRSQKPGHRVLQAGEANRVGETPSVDSKVGKIAARNQPSSATMTSGTRKTIRRQREVRPRSLNDDGVDAVCRDEEVAGNKHRCEGQVIGDLTSPVPLCPATQAQGQGRCSDIDLHVTSPPDVNSAPVVQTFSTAPALGAKWGAFLDCLAVSSNQESQNLFDRVADPRIDNIDSNPNLQVGLPGEDADAVRRAAIASTRFTRDAIVGAHPQATNSVARTAGNSVKLFTNTPADYRQLVTLLDSMKGPFFTYQLKEERMDQRVIRGLPREMSTEDIKKDLVRQGIADAEVQQMKTRNTKQQLPLDRAQPMLPLPAVLAHAAKLPSR
ncbi:unnamed protein product [Acanthoscelides obtectus]|uniref:DUF4817 domain-containing protein n=1 Tax=Acanthoscelides obtectus TaxID=200917 RepID=A0A9P0JP51_ACAOB|nr:unnamed protein product [Acanthoscelides obtectus]CAK1671248.1 hypothetical protein AOBTE_LOCUS28183 [Acanthoscelides obtectus]